MSRPPPFWPADFRDARLPTPRVAIAREDLREEIRALDGGDLPGHLVRAIDELIDAKLEAFDNGSAKR